MSDSLGRTPISDSVKRTIADTLAAIPDDKRAAAVVIADEHGSRVVLAAKLKDGWRVAGGAGRDWQGQTHASVQLVGVW